MIAMMPVDPNRKVKLYTRKQKIIRGIVIIGILLIMLVARVVIKSLVYNNDAASVTASTDTKSSSTDTTPISDADYGNWFADQENKLLSNMKEVVNAQNLYYNGYESWEGQYMVAVDDLQSQYSEVYLAARPSDEQLLEANGKLLFYLKVLLDDGNEALNDYNKGDKDGMVKLFDDQRTVAKEISPVMEQVVAILKSKGL
jgi:hypothetical protein